MSQIRYLVVHCADTPDDRNHTAEDIHRWHLERGWSGIGYHAVITRDGQIQTGRPDYWQGAHVNGHNAHSLGVCLIGRNKFTNAQFDALAYWISDKLAHYPGAQVVGHCDLDPKKTCPNFNVKGWWEARKAAGV